MRVPGTRPRARTWAHGGCSPRTRPAHGAQHRSSDTGFPVLCELPRLVLGVPGAKASADRRESRGAGGDRHTDTVVRAHVAKDREPPGGLQGGGSRDSRLGNQFLSRTDGY